MESGAPRGPGGRTKTDLRSGRLSAMDRPTLGKTQHATTDAEQDFLLSGEDPRDEQPPASFPPAEKAE